MAKLHFRYGTMGSSKSAQVLMTRFNYVERGRKVWLLKPSVDTRDGATIIKSRIGLQAEAIVIHPNDDIIYMFEEAMRLENNIPDIIIVDEAQFLQEDQVLQLRNIVSTHNVPVLCYGLRTDFRHTLFPGSKALFELADEIDEVKSICQCGEKAIINARLDCDGQVVTEGEVVDLGGNEKYVGMCWKCYQKALTKRVMTKIFEALK